MFFDNIVGNPWVVKIVAALAILLIGFVIGRFFGNISRIVIKELELNSIIRRKINIKFNLENYAYYIISFIIYIFAIDIALNQLGITKIVLIIVPAIIILIALILVFLGVKGIIPSIVSGIALYLNGNVHPGDYLQLPQVEGRVVRVKLTETVIINEQQFLVFIPNKIIIQNRIIGKKIKP